MLSIPKLTVKTPERQQRCLYVNFIVNFEKVITRLNVFFFLNRVERIMFLTIFVSPVSSYAPLKYQKTRGFPMFSWDIKLPVVLNRLKILRIEDHDNTLPYLSISVASTMKISLIKSHSPFQV